MQVALRTVLEQLRSDDWALQFDAVNSFRRRQIAPPRMNLEIRKGETFGDPRNRDAGARAWRPFRRARIRDRVD
eukprot:6114982-Pleurochrysis_carterae.AAC.2